MDKYKRSITQVSNFIILYFKNKGLELTPMKLQKILYYLQAWHIAYFDKKLLFEELPQAWNSGPVYETIFKKYEDVYYNNVDITNDIDFISNMDIELEYSQNNLDLDKNELKVFYAVLQYYGMMSHDKLVFLTHAEYPWNDAREHCDELDDCNEYISIDSMYRYYSKSIKKKENA